MQLSDLLLLILSHMGMHIFFPTGIWSAALDGDLERVRLFLKKGTDLNMKDQAGYTALVSNKPLRIILNVVFGQYLPYSIFINSLHVDVQTM